MIAGRGKERMSHRMAQERNTKRGYVLRSVLGSRYLASVLTQSRAVRSSSFGSGMFESSVMGLLLWCQAIPIDYRVNISSEFWNMWITLVRRECAKDQALSPIGSIR